MPDVSLNKSCPGALQPHLALALLIDASAPVLTVNFVFGTLVNASFHQPVILHHHLLRVTFCLNARPNLPF